MTDLEARKKLLVAESEVYRQTLRLDIQNVKLYSLRLRRKWAQYAALKPIVLAGLPVASALFSRKRQAQQAPRTLISSVIAGWRMYQKAQPVIAALLAKYMAQRQEAETPATEEPRSTTSDSAGAI